MLTLSTSGAAHSPLKGKSVGFLAALRGLLAFLPAMGHRASIGYIVSSVAAAWGAGQTAGTMPEHQHLLFSGLYSKFWILSLIVCMEHVRLYVHTYVPHIHVRMRGLFCGALFFSTFTWVWRIKLRWWACATSTFACLAVLPAPGIILNNYNTLIECRRILGDSPVPICLVRF